MQRISITEVDYAIRWIEIYPVDNANQRLNIRGQHFIHTGASVLDALT